MQTVVRSFLAYELTESAAVLAIITAAQVVPLLALALFGGAVADRVDRRRLLQACQGATLVATLFVAVSITTNTVTWYHLLASGMVHGGVWAFMSPARQGLIKDLVGRRGLANAIALTGAGLSTVSLAAPAVGGLLYAYLGPAGVSYLSAGVVLVSVILIGFIPKQAQAAGDRRANVVDDIRTGLAYMRQDTLLLVIIGTVVATMMLVHPVMTLLPVLTAEVFDRGSDAYGLLVSMLGVGSLVGSLAAAWLGRWRRGLLLVGGNIAAGAALVALASVPLWYAALPIMVVVGLSEAGRRALSQALIMERADDAHQGRVISVYTMSFGLTPIGVLPAGVRRRVHRHRPHNSRTRRHHAGGVRAGGRYPETPPRAQLRHPHGTGSRSRQGNSGGGPLLLLPTAGRDPHRRSPRPQRVRPHRVAAWTGHASTRPPVAATVQPSWITATGSRRVWASTTIRPTSTWPGRH